MIILIVSLALDLFHRVNEPQVIIYAAATEAISVDMLLVWLFVYLITSTLMG